MDQSGSRCATATAKAAAKARRSEAGASWKVQSAKWRSVLEVPPEFEPWTRHSQPTSGQQLGKRALDLMNCSAMQCWKRARVSFQAPLPDRRAILQNTILDLSQSHDRRPFSGETGPVRTLTTSSLLYSFRENRILRPLEHLCLQGYPRSVSVPESFSDRDTRVLAGEAMSLPSLGLVVWSLLVLKGFPQ